MTSQIEPMTRRFAAIAALVTFAVCVYAGLAAGNPVLPTLQRALLGLAAGGVVGGVVGWMARTMVEDAVAADERRARDKLAEQSDQAARAALDQPGNPATSAKATGAENPNRTAAPAGLSR